VRVGHDDPTTRGAASRRSQARGAACPYDHWSTANLEIRPGAGSVRTPESVASSLPKRCCRRPETGALDFLMGAEIRPRDSRRPRHERASRQGHVRSLSERGATVGWYIAVTCLEDDRITRNHGLAQLGVVQWPFDPKFWLWPRPDLYRQKRRGTSARSTTSPPLLRRFRNRSLGKSATQCSRCSIDQATTRYGGRVGSAALARDCTR